MSLLKEPSSEILSLRKEGGVLIVGAESLSGKAILRSLKQTYGGLIRGCCNSQQESKEIEREIGLKEIVIVEDNNDIEKSFERIDRMCLVFGDTEEGPETVYREFIDQAKKHQIEHILLVCPIGTQDTCLSAIESHVQQSGILWTIIRNMCCQENFLRLYKGKNSDILPLPTDKAKFAPICSIDLGDACTHILASNNIHRHKNKIYLLTGPQLITGKQLAEIISEKTHKSIRHASLTTEGTVQYLQMAGISESEARKLCNLYEYYSKNQADFISLDGEKLLHRKLINIEDFASANAHNFRICSNEKKRIHLKNIPLLKNLVH